MSDKFVVVWAFTGSTRRAIPVGEEYLCDTAQMAVAQGKALSVGIRGHGLVPETVLKVSEAEFDAILASKRQMFELSDLAGGPDVDFVEMTK